MRLKGTFVELWLVPSIESPLSSTGSIEREGWSWKGCIERYLSRFRQKISAWIPRLLHRSQSSLVLLRDLFLPSIRCLKLGFRELAQRFYQCIQLSWLCSARWHRYLTLLPPPSLTLASEALTWWGWRRCPMNSFDHSCFLSSCGNRSCVPRSTRFPSSDLTFCLYVLICTLLTFIILLYT